MKTLQDGCRTAAADARPHLMLRPIVGTGRFAQPSETHSLFTLSKTPPAGEPAGKLLLPIASHQSWASQWAGLPPTDRLVEVNGIEPSTSCLQSRRSPN